MNQRPLIYVAYHEAAHAVLAWYFEIEMVSASIIPQTDFSGITKFHKPLHNFNPERDYGTRGTKLTHRYVMCCLAGVIAEVKLDPSVRKEATDCGEDDRRTAEHLLSNLYGPADLVARRLEQFKTYTKKVLDRKDIWNSGTALADALLERKIIPSEDMRKIIEEAFVGGR